MANRSGSWVWALSGAGGEAGAGHALAQAAFSQEILLQSPELLVEEVIGLVDQTDENVGHDFGLPGLDERPERFILWARPALGDGEEPIHLYILHHIRPATDPADFNPVDFLPLSQAEMRIHAVTALIAAAAMHLVNLG